VETSQIRQQIATGAEQLENQLPPGAAGCLTHLVEELIRWNRKVNLTAIRDTGEIVTSHIMDSLSVRPLLQGQRIIDIGTGPGFPGLPLAIAAPDLEFVLLDSNGKKIGFVQHMIGELGLKNVRAVKARAEDYAPEQRFDTVLARALAAIPQLTAWAAHLLADHGVLLAQKGKYPAEELGGLVEGPATWEYTVTELTVPGLEEHSRHVVCLRRVVVP
jgi:16S rRNA (guanine527-N7)-methyltransferase